jgi:hypothetical protein
MFFWSHNCEIAHYISTAGWPLEGNKYSNLFIPFIYLSLSPFHLSPLKLSYALPKMIPRKFTKLMTSYAFY